MRHSLQFLNPARSNQALWSRFFRKHINKFNNAFCITSAGMKRDYLPSAGRAPQVFKLQGMPGHKSGPMLPRDGDNPQYAQLYLLETRDASILRAEQSKYFKNGHSRRVGSRAVVIDTYEQPPRADGYACFDAIPGVGGAAKATRTRGRAHVR